MQMSDEPIEPGAGDLSKESVISHTIKTPGIRRSLFRARRHVINWSRRMQYDTC